MTDDDVDIVASPENVDVERVKGAVNTSRTWKIALGGAILYILYFFLVTLFNRNTEMVKGFPVIFWILIAPVGAALYLIVLGYTIRAITKLSFTNKLTGGLFFLTLLVYLLVNPLSRKVILACYPAGRWREYSR